MRGCGCVGVAVDVCLRAQEKKRLFVRAQGKKTPERVRACVGGRGWSPPASLTHLLPHHYHEPPPLLLAPSSLLPPALPPPPPATSPSSDAPHPGVMQYMRALADAGHVVLASVHQPRAAIWGMFTQVRGGG